MIPTSVNNPYIINLTKNLWSKANIAYPSYTLRIIQPNNGSISVNGEIVTEARIPRGSSVKLQINGTDNSYPLEIMMRDNGINNWVLTNYAGSSGSNVTYSFIMPGWNIDASGSCVNYFTNEIVNGSCTFKVGNYTNDYNYRFRGFFRNSYLTEYKGTNVGSLTSVSSGWYIGNIGVYGRINCWNNASSSSSQESYYDARYNSHSNPSNIYSSSNLTYIRRKSTGYTNTVYWNGQVVVNGTGLYNGISSWYDNSGFVKYISGRSNDASVTVTLSSTLYSNWAAGINQGDNYLGTPSSNFQDLGVYADSVVNNGNMTVYSNINRFAGAVVDKLLYKLQINRIEYATNATVYFDYIDPIYNGTNISIGFGNSDAAYVNCSKHIVSGTIELINGQYQLQGTVTTPICCVPYYAEILKEDGSIVRVEELIIGDRILGYDFETNTCVFTEVLKIGKPIRTRLCQITLENGAVMEITPNHVIYTDQGWAAYEPDAVKEVENSILISLNQKALFSDNKYYQIINIKINEYPETIQCYDLTTGTHNYFADNFLVHNVKCPD